MQQLGAALPMQRYVYYHSYLLQVTSRKRMNLVAYTASKSSLQKVQLLCPKELCFRFLYFGAHVLQYPDFDSRGPRCARGFMSYHIHMQPCALVDPSFTRRSPLPPGRLKRNFSGIQPGSPPGVHAPPQSRTARISTRTSTK